MKKMRVITSIILILLLTVSSFAVTSDEVTTEVPNGAHYNLNIIGVSNPKTADMDGSNGHVIFVALDGASQINLTQGEEFQVLDANGTDKDGAEFMLPAPGFDAYIVGDVEEAWTDYSVWVRPLGKPGGWSTITTCATLVESKLGAFLDKKDLRFIDTLNRDGLFGGIASIEQVGQDMTIRPKGKSVFTDVTAELTSIVLEITVEYEDEGVLLQKTIYVRVPLFDPLMENYYWEYDNEGLKLLQVRFYPIGVDVTESDIW